jgi:signal transduction histidine kinase
MAESVFPAGWIGSATRQKRFGWMIRTRHAEDSDRMRFDSLSTWTMELEQALSQFQGEVINEEGTAFRVIVQGKQRPLYPRIRDEVYSVGREAIVNAFRHAHARNIEIEIEYSNKHLRLVVRDDGRGIDQSFVRSHPERHKGLSSMCGRVERIGGSIKILTRITAGTEIEVSVPGKIPFQGHAATAGGHA